MCEETVKQRNHINHLHPYLHKYNIDIKEDLSNNYVVDLIGDEYKKWNAWQPVFLHAGTGKGKTTFVLQKLVKNAYKNKKNVLYFVNRIALNSQQQKIFVSEINKYRKNLDERLRRDGPFALNDRNYLDYGNVLIMSYQSALHHLNVLKKLDKDFLDNVEYIVFDECDFFISDAEFNGKVGPILDTLRSFIHENCYGSKRIYMSATLDSVFDILYNSEKLMFDASKPNNYYGDIEFNPSYYYFPQNYDNYKFYIFDDWSLIHEIINESEGQKFLCFVKSSADGEKFAYVMNKIWKGTDRKATFISRKNRNDNDTYKQIIDSETFEIDVVFTTMLLDRGINITTKGNDKVTNIVLDAFFDEAEIKQMIGRLRTSDNQINVYLKSITPKDIDNQRYLLLEKINYIDSFSTIEHLDEQIEYLRKYDIPYYCTYDREILIHPISKDAINKKIQLINLYKKAIVEKNVEQYFPFSIERYIAHFREPLKVQPTVVETENGGAINVHTFHYDDMTCFDTYDQLLLSWFDKKQAQRIFMFRDTDRDEWEKFFEKICIVRHKGKNPDGSNNKIFKKDYYVDYYNKGYCGYAKEYNVIELVEDLKNKDMIAKEKEFSDNSDVFNFFEKAIKYFNLNYQLISDAAEIRGVNEAKAGGGRKDLLFISRIEDID